MNGRALWVARFACGHDSLPLQARPRRGGWITCTDGRCQGQRRVISVTLAEEPPPTGRIVSAGVQDALFGREEALEPRAAFRVHLYRWDTSAVHVDPQGSIGGGKRRLGSWVCVMCRVLAGFAETFGLDHAGDCPGLVASASGELAGSQMEEAGLWLSAVRTRRAGRKSTGPRRRRSRRRGSGRSGCR